MSNMATESTNPFASDDAEHQERLIQARTQTPANHNPSSQNSPLTKVAQPGCGDAGGSQPINAAHILSPPLVGTDQRAGDQQPAQLTDWGVNLSQLGLDDEENGFTRLVFLPSDPENSSLAPKGLSQGKSPTLASEWVELGTENNEESFKTVKVLAFAQTIYDVACNISIKIPRRGYTIAFRICLNPTRDEVTLINQSKPTLAASQDSGEKPAIILYHTTSANLGPGAWEPSASGITTKLLILPRRFFSSPAQPPTPNNKSPPAKPIKRAIAESTGTNAVKRARGLLQSINIHTLPSPDVLVDVSAPSHILGDLRVGQTVQLLGSKSCERYSITRVKTLLDRRPASVWQVAMSTFHEPVVAKVLTYTDDTRAAARMWLQETRIHSKVGSDKHQAIVQLLGVDARVHAFYMEAVQASSLGDKSFRDHHGHFSGTNNNAERILNDMVSTLSWVHGLGVVRNDIKPANILFSKTRGAVLIDFGLSTDTPHEEVGKADGTPWYLPPEFLNFQWRRLAKSVSGVSFVILFTAQQGRFGFLIINDENLGSVIWLGNSTSTCTNGDT